MREDDTATNNDVIYNANLHLVSQNKLKTQYQSLVNLVWSNIFVLLALAHATTALEITEKNLRKTSILPVILPRLMYESTYKN